MRQDTVTTTPTSRSTTTPPCELSRGGARPRLFTVHCYARACRRSWGRPGLRAWLRENKLKIIRCACHDMSMADPECGITISEPPAAKARRSVWRSRLSRTLHAGYVELYIRANFPLCRLGPRRRACCRGLQPDWLGNSAAWIQRGICARNNARSD